jgi:hypothetical protein
MTKLFYKFFDSFRVKGDKTPLLMVGFFILNCIYYDGQRPSRRSTQENTSIHKA